MEFQLNAKKYTIKCSFRPTTIHLSKKWNIDTFDMEPSERKFIPDIRNIIEREFNLIDHNKKNKITLNSIQQCYRSFYLIQDTINEILAGNSDTRTAILRSLLRQPDQSNQFPDVNTELNVLKNKNKNEIDKINTELKLKLKKLEVDVNRLGLSYKIKFDSANRLKDLKFKGWIKNEIDKNQKVKIKYDKIYEETSDLIKTLKDPEILAIEKSIIVVENKINACSMKIGENRSKFDEIDKKLDKLKIKSSEIAQMIQKESWKLTIVKGDFLICPKCKRPITPEMKQREKQNPPLCPICNRGFELTKGMEVEELKESQRLNALEQQESINLMNLLKVEIEKNEKEILDLKNAKSTLEKK